MGKTTLDKLSNYATKRGISLFAALFEEGFAAECNPAQLGNVLDFGNFINDIQFRQTKEPAGDLLNAILKAIEYEAYLYDCEEVKAAEKRYANVVSFVEWLAKKVRMIIKPYLS